MKTFDIPGCNVPMPSSSPAVPTRAKAPQTSRPELIIREESVSIKLAAGKDRHPGGAVIRVALQLPVKEVVPCLSCGKAG